MHEGAHYTMCRKLFKNGCDMHAIGSHIVDDAVMLVCFKASGTLSTMLEFLTSKARKYTR